MKSNMKKLIAILLLVPAITAQAQDNWKPNKQDLDRAGSAGHFAETLIKAALPAGKSADSLLSYLADEKTWVCHIAIDGTKFTVDAKDPVPERACVQAVLSLAHQGAI
jgi:hypothetical protein